MPGAFCVYRLRLDDGPPFSIWGQGQMSHESEEIF
jgi:hypothetical protein